MTGDLPCGKKDRRWQSHSSCLFLVGRPLSRSGQVYADSPQRPRELRGGRERLTDPAPQTNTSQGLGKGISVSGGHKMVAPAPTPGSVFCAHVFKVGRMQLATSDSLGKLVTAGECDRHSSQGVCATGTPQYVGARRQSWQWSPFKTKSRGPCSSLAAPRLELCHTQLSSRDRLSLSIGCVSTTAGGGAPGAWLPPLGMDSGPRASPSLATVAHSTGSTRGEVWGRSRPFTSRLASPLPAACKILPPTNSPPTHKPTPGSGHSRPESLPTSNHRHPLRKLPDPSLRPGKVQAERVRHVVLPSTGLWGADKGGLEVIDSAFPLCRAG